jgi:hypothetical protein
MHETHLQQTTSVDGNRSTTNSSTQEGIKNEFITQCNSTMLVVNLSRDAVQVDHDRHPVEGAECNIEHGIQRTI